LLVNLLLGEREAQIDGSYEAFRRVGLAHVLAISGFHLSVLAGLVLLVLRLGGSTHRWHGVVVIAVVLIYLWLVEAHAGASCGRDDHGRMPGACVWPATARQRSGFTECDRLAALAAG
jgi:hypothetical protein